MKVTLNHAKLTKMLQYASRSVSQKPNIPILANVKLDATKSGLKLSATNLDMGINMWIPGVVEEEGSTTVSAKFLSDFVSATSSESVELELKDSILLVKTQKSKAKFNTIPASEFPVLPNTGEGKFLTMSIEDFEKSMDKVLFACSNDTSPGKIQQTGVLFEVVDEVSLNLVGIDGFRLSLRKVNVAELNKDLIGESQLIVPARYLSDFNKILADIEEIDRFDVFISENKTQVIFKIDEIEYSVRLLEGPYPDYKRIMPDTYTYAFDVSKSELEGALKVISTFARSNLAYKTLFDMDVESKNVKLRSNVADIGENETAFEIENVEGEMDMNAAYNLRYLQDIVNHIRGGKLRFETKGPLAASIFKDLDDENFIHLLMPLRREN